MNYIIDPAWFYFAGVLGKISEISFGFALVSFFGAVVFAVCGFLETDKNLRKTSYRLAVRLTIAAAVCFLVYIVVPSAETMYEIMIARIATYDNAEWTLDTIKTAVDYIVQQIASLK